jgi:hypothetical protein
VCVWGGVGVLKMVFHGFLNITRDRKP